MLNDAKTEIPLHCCRVCGAFYKDHYPWGPDGKTPLYTICSCCRVEFGNEDCDGEGIEKYRANWLNEGGDWLDHHTKPRHWNRVKQLEHILDAETVHKLLAKHQVSAK